jgi:tripartite-type tricarboxylate transporter receptor subunit TctC
MMNLRGLIVIGVMVATSVMANGSTIAAEAAAYPTKAITLVVTFPPGGGSDAVARPLASVAQQHLGQPMVILNKPGGSGAVGAQYVANAKPDGYTLLHAINIVSELPQVDEMLGRPPAFRKEQFIPIGQVSVTPFALMVTADSRWKTFGEFVAEARQKPDEFQYASAGMYSTTHFMWEMIIRATGIRVRHMPTTGGGPIMMAVLGKNVDIGHCVVPAVCAPQVDARKVRLLAMTSEKRLPAYPDVPTLKELGYDVTHSLWHAMMAPAGTSPEVVAKLRQALRAMVEGEAFKTLMTKLGERPQYMSGEAFEKFWAEDYQKVGALLRELIKK